MGGKQPDQASPVFPNQRGGFCRPEAAPRLHADLEAAGVPSSFAGKVLETRGHAALVRDVARSRWRSLGPCRSDVGPRAANHASPTLRCAQSRRARDAVTAIALPIGPAFYRVNESLRGIAPISTNPESSPTKPSESLSHLRDLNSRPTVYEDDSMLRKSLFRRGIAKTTRTPIMVFSRRFRRLTETNRYQSI